MQFASAMVSHDWRRLGYPSVRVAKFWDSRSCGIACLRMAFGALNVVGSLGPAALTEALLKRGAYSEASGWNHSRLAAYANELELSAAPQRIDSIDQLLRILASGAVVIVSVGHNFETPGRAGHLAVLLSIVGNGEAVLHMPSGDDPHQGRGITVSTDVFWEHFSGRAVVLSNPDHP
ncbi:hypothetical protein CVS30_10045 [Arthrobacter psychrolactophilus]|uniref:Peptidase C39-like domain-containing protein n=1 Tax=Arthrobacter psychrolactophilus TaxID=92442 RepID=A0A2V5IPD5_9MICC|nr:C39 family peptidase [Arthrobacter psychrolactophilus]PYI38459.1 hypothetical protein CVS30_10045 [Arthrobacter psychrolactophilus]